MRAFDHPELPEPHRKVELRLESGRVREMRDEQGRPLDVVALEEPDEDGRTPLMMACYNGKLECVRMLVLQGKVKVDGKSDAGKTARMYAEGRKNDKIVAFLDNPHAPPPEEEEEDEDDDEDDEEEEEDQEDQEDDDEEEDKNRDERYRDVFYSSCVTASNTRRVSR